MSYEHMWVLIGIFALALWAGLAIWARHLREAKRLALREMIHRERMAALEKGSDLPELPADLARSADAEDEDGPPDVGAWIQRAALAAGFVLVLGGAGMGLGLKLLPGTPNLQDLQSMAPLGAVPILVGVGLLLYAWVDRWLFREKRS